MDETLRALGGILLKAIPTFVLVFVLYLYLGRVFFRPLEKVLRKRYEATEGARKLADESLANATAKTEEYEAAMRAARADLYRELEQLRRELQQERAAKLEEARHKAEAQVTEGKAQLAAQVQELKQTLAAESEALANQIADSILRRRTA
ncbi:MAG: hypothetical protein DMG57_32185 [Acidobacteria bacterium]|nr:MAG: hypothetical protein DMG57_32185 [Acidobacteriota bacterium]